MSTAETLGGSCPYLSVGVEGLGHRFQNHASRGPGVARGAGLQFAARAVRGLFHRANDTAWPSSFLVYLKDYVGRLLGSL